MLRVTLASGRRFFIADWSDDEANAEPPFPGLVPVLAACKHTTQLVDGQRIRKALPDTDVYGQEAADMLRNGDVMRHWLNPSRVAYVDELD